MKIWTKQKHQRRGRCAYVISMIVALLPVMLGLVGCDSGDDGDSNPPPVTEQPQTDPIGDAGQASYAMTAGIMELGAGATEWLMSGPSDATGPGNEPLAIAPPPGTIACDFGTGPLNVTHRDNDANMSVSAGDGIDIVANNCALDDDGDANTTNDRQTLNGRMTLTVNTVSGDPPTVPWDVSANASFTDLQVPANNSPVTYTGNFNFSVNADSAGLHFVQTGGPVTATTADGACTVSGISNSQDVNNTNQYSASFQGDVSCNRPNFPPNLTVRTTTPFSGTVGGNPTGGQMVFATPQNASARLTAQPDGTNVTVELDANADGAYETTVSPSPTWDTLSAFPLLQLSQSGSPPSPPPPPPTGGATVLPDTWQTMCYGASMAVIDCLNTGQDGAYTRNQMGFTDNGNGTVTDNVTGLMWQQSDDDVVRTAGDPYCDNLVLGGFSDWMLPSKRQMMTMLHYGHLHSAVSVAHFPGTNIGSNSSPGGHNDTYYWTSTPMARDPASNWAVNYHEGAMFGRPNASTGYMRCVRNAATPAPSFVDNGNETVTDQVTGLMWQKQSNAAANWDSALAVCEALDFAGQTDWRLPNVKELGSIVDPGAFNPAINPTYFPGTQAGGYWSSTTAVHQANNAWVVSFGDGDVLETVDKGTPVAFRCVRTAP